MSQIEQAFREYLAHHPEIERAYIHGLINRRALARHVIEKAKIAKISQFEAVLAMIRRYHFQKPTAPKRSFEQIAIKLRDDIVIVEIDRSVKTEQVVRELLEQKSEEIKVVVGTNAITVYLDSKTADNLGKIFAKAKTRSVCEISMLFAINAQEAEGIIAAITAEFLLEGISIAELISSKNELLVYIDQKEAARALSLLNRLKGKYVFSLGGV